MNNSTNLFNASAAHEVVTLCCLSYGESHSRFAYEELIALTSFA